MRDCWLVVSTSLLGLLVTTGAQPLTAKGVPASSIEGVTLQIPPGANGKHVDFKPLARTCDHVEGITRATLLVWGIRFYTQTPSGCCQACRKKVGCNTWKYCAGADGCGGLFKTRECWLKHGNPLWQNYSYVFTDERSPNYVTGFVKGEKIPMAIDLYYANGEFQSSVDSGEQVKSLSVAIPSGEFKYVSIGDCAHLCELYRSRGCDSFHYNKATFNDIDSCTLASGASKETVSTNSTHVTTFFRDMSIPTPKGLTSLGDYWSHGEAGDAFRAIDDRGTMSVIFGSGIRMNYNFVTVEECADICSITEGCVSFEYQATGGGDCVLKSEVHLYVKRDDSGWRTFWHNGIAGPAVVVDENHSDKDNLPSTLWITVGIGLVSVCLLLVGLVIVLYKKRTTIIVVKGSNECKLVGALSPPLSEVDLSLDYESLGVDKENPLGSGSFGVVYRGMYESKHVAVKVLSPAFQTGPYLRSFQEEMKILCRVRHDNIVLCYGGSVLPPKICIVEELMEMSLGDLLYPAEKKGYQMSIKEILKLSVEVSAALSHIHPIIIHRDLKPANILLDKKKRAKIADFGLSRIKASTYLSTECATRGTISYMAPECFSEEGSGITEKVDIYALACIMWECLSGEPPWNKLPNQFAIINNVAFSAMRPEIPKKTPKILADIITDCWAQSPKDRPTAHEVLERTSELLKCS